MVFVASKSAPLSSLASSSDAIKLAKMELPWLELVMTLMFDGLRECLEAEEARAALAILLLDNDYSKKLPPFTNYLSYVDRVSYQVLDEETLFGEYLL